jgi:hypothetical protein
VSYDETGTTYPSRTHVFHINFLCWSVLLIFLVICVVFSVSQIYDRVVNCPLQYINGRGFSNYNISLGHISTNQNSCFIAKAMFDEFCVVMSVKISEKKTIFGSSLPQVFIY